MLILQEMHNYYHFLFPIIIHRYRLQYQMGKHIQHLKNYFCHSNILFGHV